MSKQAAILVLCSGGLDSTACLAYYLENGYQPHALWVDYGHKSAAPELEAITKVAAHYSVPLKTIEIRGIEWVFTTGTDEIIGRNALLASIGLSTFPSRAGLVAMGIHTGTDYLDCSPAFLSEISNLARITSDSRLDIDFPFKNLTKLDIGVFCKEHNVPIDLTYSCTKGSVPPCGECNSCRDRRYLEDYLGIRRDEHG